MNYTLDKDEMDFEEQEPDKESEPTEIPKEQRKLRTQPYDKSITDLVQMISDEDIILDPDYQRNYIWDNKKASLLIESILLNVPIPVIYVSEDEENRWIVVDGLQRLYSLSRFYKNEFKLSGLEILNELNKTQYSKLNSKAKRILNNGVIRIIVLLQETHPEIKYDIFLRLNRGAVKLNEQELRNCLYRGRLNRLLHELRYNEQFLNCLRLKQPHKRFNDAELILRYFAFSEAYDINKKKLSDYPNQIKNFLNAYMEKHIRLTEDEENLLKKKFTDTISKVYHVFEDNAFRRMKSDNNFDTKLNRSLMDIVMVSFENYDVEAISKNKANIINLYKKLPADDEKFQDSISMGTSSTRNVEYRFNKWFDEMNKIMGI